MLITEQNIDIWYREYKAQRQRSEKYVKSRKGVTRGLPVSTRAEFKLDFLTTVSDNPKLSGKQIAQKMAKDETFPLTNKQVMNIAKAISTYHGIPVTPQLVAQIRVGATGADPFWADVTARQYELHAQGYKWKSSDPNEETVETLVSQEFFGS